ncbi:MAG: 3-dehydroquinate synthase [Roseibacillus sp.]|nr:3-dehydroquinate synthase [Roseibacillus sp.]
MPTVTVNLPDRSYDILVEPGSISGSGQLIKKAGLTGRVALITDANVALHYSETVQASLQEADFQVSSHLIPPGESSKSMEQAQSLCRSLIEHHHDRGSFVVALGGGVVGDVAGFVASIFYRGIPFVQIPTTIVAQVDSSVGGKTGVNVPEGKNLIGTFQQPRLVLVDPDVLVTLPDQVFHEGFAEVIKHAAIRDARMLEKIEGMDPGNREIDPRLIADNLAIKARIVEEDEREISGTRALLNFGHTIGHAIEATAEYGTLLHGEAISLGVRAALHLSEKKAGLSPEDTARLLSIHRHWHLPLMLDLDISTEAVMDALARDKKFTSGQIRFVLLKRLGEAFVSDEITREDLLEAIELLRTPV